MQILLIVSICVCFIIFLKAANVKESILLIRQVGAYAGLILIVTVLAYLAGAWGWKYCIDSNIKLSIIQLFIIRHVGNTITLLNPTGAIAGELFNAKMLMSRGIKEKDAYKAVLLSRILMTLSQLVLLIILFTRFILFLSAKVPQEIMYPIYACFCVVIFVVPASVYLLLKKEKVKEISLTDNKWEKIICRITEMRFLLGDYFRKHPEKTAKAFLLFSAQWMFGSLELFFILYFLKYNIGIFDGLFLDTLIIVLKSTVSFIPGQLGVEELINGFALYLIGISSTSLWLSVSILRRTRQLFWSSVALPFYIQLKKRKKPYKNHGDIICEP